MQTDNAITIAQLNSYVSNIISAEDILQNVLVCGEISNFGVHRASGHAYFSLKDEGSTISAIMWSGSVKQLKWEPENGTKVFARGDVSVYEKGGSYALHIREMQPDGVGERQLALEQLKKKLEAEGLFAQELKKKLPKFPRTIGVVTSKGGAALQDILNVIKRRWKAVTVVLADANVQGEYAVPSLRAALANIQQIPDIDVIIIGRGGGSAEDLWCFNDEMLARDISRCPVPTISAVGHEIDFSLSDFVADLRAPTPSAAAELCVPDSAEFFGYLADRLGLMRQQTECKAGQLDSRAKLAESMLSKDVIIRRLNEKMHAFDNAVTALDTGFHGMKESYEVRFDGLMNAVDNLSPMKTLKRGYSVATKEGKNIKSVKQVSAGDIIMTRLKDGEIISEVK